MYKFSKKKICQAFLAISLPIIGTGIEVQPANAEFLTHCERFGRYDPKCATPKQRPKYKTVLKQSERININNLFAEIKPELRKIYVGLYGRDFEALEYLKSQQFQKGTNSNTPVGTLSVLFPNLKRNMQIRLKKSRYTPVVAQYALIKANSIGLCGNPGKEFKVRNFLVTTTHNQYGGELDRWSRETGSDYFKVEKKFANLITQSNTKSAWFDYADGVRKVIEKLGGCNSVHLQKLEKNMLDYQKWNVN